MAEKPFFPTKFDQVHCVSAANGIADFALAVLPASFGLAIAKARERGNVRMYAMRTAERLLQQHGFDLIRSRKHRIWRKGKQTISISSSASDKNGEKRAMAEMWKRFGIRSSPHKPSPKRRPELLPIVVPAPVEAAQEIRQCQVRPLTAEEQALLAKWERDEQKRIAKEDRLLRRWEHEEEQRKERFAKWLRIQAGVGEEAWLNMLAFAVDEDVEIDPLEFWGSTLERFLTRAATAEIAKGSRIAMHLFSLRAEDEPDDTWHVFMPEVQRVPGERSWFVDFTCGETYDHSPHTERPLGWTSKLVYQHVDKLEDFAGT